VFGRAAPTYERAGPPFFGVVARRRGRQAGVGNAALAVMDAEALGCRAGTFDAVLCASALSLLPHPVAALRGFGRVLRPGGTLAVAVEVERLDVAYADAATWWASDWSHGERALLELMREPALAAYRTAAFQAIQRCRERDGALHWRPEVVHALAGRSTARLSRG
jgi:ubiquinone/menaquinone biosynthesis C-methylase UbiE